MKPIKCSNCSNYYDADKYDECPHCDSEQEQTSALRLKSIRLSETRPEQSKKEKKSFFTKKKKSNESIPNSEGNYIESYLENGDRFADELYEQSELNYGGRIHTLQDETIVSAYADNVTAQPEPAVLPIFEQPSAQSSGIPPEKEPIDASAPSLSQAIQKTNSTSGDQKTVAFYNTGNNSEPVVGWLVCISGEYLGDSFNLKTGYNNIGRSGNMDVVLARDGSVSRDTHATVIFEPKKKQFLVNGGKNSALTYLNDELVTGNVLLKAKDEICIGDCKLVFVPLCGEDFSWDTYID